MSFTVRNSHFFSWSDVLGVHTSWRKATVQFNFLRLYVSSFLSAKNNNNTPPSVPQQGYVEEREQSIFLL